MLKKSSALILVSLVVGVIAGVFAAALAAASLANLACSISIKVLFNLNISSSNKEGKFPALFIFIESPKYPNPNNFKVQSKPPS